MISSHLAPVLSAFYHQSETSNEIFERTTGLVVYYGSSTASFVIFRYIHRTINYMAFPAGGQFIVQGASRGIGFAITKQILARDPDSFVLATCRGIPSQVEALASLQRKHKSRLKFVSLDFSQVGVLLV